MSCSILILLASMNMTTKDSTAHHLLKKKKKKLFFLTLIYTSTMFSVFFCCIVLWLAGTKLSAHSVIPSLLHNRKRGTTELVCIISLRSFVCVNFKVLHFYRRHCFLMGKNVWVDSSRAYPIKKCTIPSKQKDDLNEIRAGLRGDVVVCVCI